MSFITLAIVNSVLTSIEAGLQAGHEIDHGVLGSFNAGISHLLLSGREPAAPEIAALKSLAAAIVHVPESDDEEAIAPGSPPSETPSGGGEGETSEEAPSSEDPALGAAPASEAAGDAEASQASVTPGAGEPAPVAADHELTREEAAALEAQARAEQPLVETDPAVVDHSTAHEELFQKQPHDEDDGA